MSCAEKDLIVCQGATFDDEHRWLKPRFKFEALNAGTSGASAPVWPPNECDTVVDNDITWFSRGPWNANDPSDAKIDCWLPSTAYAEGDFIRTPDDPNDITGYTALLEIRTGKDNAETPFFSITEVISTTTGFIRIGDTGGDATGGIFSIVFQANATGLANGFYDLFLTTPAMGPEFPSGKTTKILKGKVKVEL